MVGGGSAGRVASDVGAEVRGMVRTPWELPCKEVGKTSPKSCLSSGEQASGLDTLPRPRWTLQCIRCTHAAHRGPAREGRPALGTHELPPRRPCSRFIRLFFFFSCAVASLQLTSCTACPAGQHRAQ